MLRSYSEYMERSVFDKFRKIVYEQSGISLGTNKDALVSARVAKRMRALGMEDHEEYLKHVLKDATGEEIVHLLDAISTNVTSFFRESNHFDLLGRVVSKWRKEGQTKYRIWSAACSTGEEPYTIAITLLEAGLTPKMDVKILATDISTKVLQVCQQGVYDSRKLEGVSSMIQDRYFDRLQEQQSTVFRVKGDLKRMVAFKRLNLSVTPFPMSGPFDVIFCRNVMIYFDNEVRRKLLNEAYRLLRPDGYLMVGHAESLTGIVSEFRAVKPSIYMK